MFGLDIHELEFVYAVKESEASEASFWSFRGKGELFFEFYFAQVEGPCTVQQLHCLVRISFF